MHVLGLTLVLAAGAADSTVTLGGIHSGKTGKNAVFSPWSGIVQDYGSMSVVPVPQDTTRSPVPTELNLPQDSVLTVAPPGDTAVLYYRNIVGIAFVDTASGPTVRALLQKYNAVIIGGDPYGGPWGEYIVRVPDPGTTFGALDSLVARIDEERAVAEASEITFHDKFDPRGRYPADGPAHRSGAVSAPAQQDTTRPPVPPTPNLPDDSTFTVPSPSGSDVRYHRNILVIAFDDSTSGATVRRVLKKYGAVIIGGSEARDEPAYYIRIPDPGTTFAAIDSVVSRVEAEPGVAWVYIPTWRGLIRIRSRLPPTHP